MVDDFYLYEFTLANNYKGKNTIIRIDFKEFVEGDERHTLGLCEVDIND